jgi:microsomal dipeptidase-like Zn-dependent dipeptidase
VPSFAADFEKRDWGDDRVVRRGGIGAKLLDRENLAAELAERNYSAESIGKILGGNMMRVLRTVLC